MNPLTFIPLARLRSHEALAAAAHERQIDELPRRDRAPVVVAAVILAGVASIVLAALLLRSILILGGFGVS